MYLRRPSSTDRIRQRVHALPKSKPTAVRGLSDIARSLQSSDPVVEPQIECHGQGKLPMDFPIVLAKASHSRREILVAKQKRYRLAFYFFDNFQILEIAGIHF